MKKNILVTGGTGFIGSHTSVELINSGYNVIIVDNLSNSKIEVLDGIEGITGVRPDFYKFDLCDYTTLDNLFSKNHIDGIIHFAAYKAVGESVEKPIEYYENNLVSLLNILKCMKKYNTKGLIFSSSCTVYGEPDKLPVTETSPIKPAECPYGNTKQIAEEIINDTAKANKSLNAILLRYFNPIGAHPSSLIGEEPNGVPANLVPYITQTAAGIRECLSIFGDTYNTPDGTCIRDYIYVVDLAKAHVCAMERLLDSKNTKRVEAYNIGTGEGTSVKEIVNTFERVTGVKLNYKIVDKRHGDIEKIYGDVTKANNILGWKSETPLDQVLLSAWNWQKKNI